MKIYTKTGDGGQTSLFGGKRVDKDDDRINAYGTVDELNSVLGIAVSFSESDEIKSVLKKIQNDLFTVGADLSTPLENKKVKVQRTSPEMVSALENYIDEYNEKLPPLRNFILPGGGSPAAYLHFARTVCRRAEREVTALSKKEEIGKEVIKYLNRLSDLLFVLARFENFNSGIPDIDWEQ